VIIITKNNAVIIPVMVYKIIIATAVVGPDVVPPVSVVVVFPNVEAPLLVDMSATISAVAVELILDK
jgi:hypothetical protein